MKVRLEPDERCMRRLPEEFQFHEGTIGTDPLARTDYDLINFNSMKVRLELPHNLMQICRSQFQFHEGTIGTVCTARKSAHPYISIP